MTCQECLHYEVCNYHICDETDMTVAECTHFTARSEWVHLPCKVRGTVYFIELEFNDKIRSFEPKIHRTTVTGYTVNERYILYHTRKDNDFTDSMLGKTVFLTREEAEKALEGLK